MKSMNKYQCCYICIGSISRSGGTERAVANLAKIYARMGYAVTIVSIFTQKNTVPFYELPDKAKICHLGISNAPSSLLSKIKWCIVLYKFLSKIIPPYSFVVGTGHNINTVISFLCKKKYVTIGCEHIQKETIPFYSKLLMRLSYWRLNVLVLLSESAKKKYISYNKHLEVISNTLPFLPHQPSLKQKKHIIMVGRIDKNKGYDRAIPIFSFLMEKYPDWSIDIYGSGDEVKNISNQLELNHLSNVHIYEPVKEINKKYEECDLMLMTSHSEAMPMVILEANAYGIPVVAYNNEGTRELILNGKTGYIIEDGNTSEFCQCLNTLITDVDTLRILSLNAYNYSKSYSLECISARWKCLMDGLI